MDKLTEYRRIIRAVLAPISNRHYASLMISNEAVIDEANDHYLVMTVGWEGRIRRVHHCLIHLDIIDGKVWIQRDGTEDGIAYDLEEAGIPKLDIVLAFHSAEVRPHTGYAVA